MGIYNDSFGNPESQFKKGPHTRINLRDLIRFR